MKNKFNEQTPQFRLKSKQLPLKKGAILKQKGFTLVELLVVISIMSVLTVVAISSFRTAQTKSRDVRRKNDLNSISKALNMYYNDVGSFPYGSTNLDLTMAGVGFSASVGGKVVTYMVEIPTETTNSVQGYSYISGTTGKSFKLFANLENTNDSSCLTDVDDYSVSNGCVYGVSSSNIKIGDDLL